MKKPDGSCDDENPPGFSQPVGLKNSKQNQKQINRMLYFKFFDPAG